MVVRALVHLGYQVDDAIFLVRYRRWKWAPNNHVFVDYLTTGRDIASLLSTSTANQPYLASGHQGPPDL